MSFKSNDYEQFGYFSVRVPREYLKVLDEICVEQCRTRNSLINYLIRDCIEKHQRKTDD